MQPPHTERRRLAWRILLALTLAAGTGAAHAQLRLPSIGLPLPQRLGPLDGEIVRGTGDRLLASV
ncbi:MAG: hypothetical protein JF619_29295, partial [Massilia sp.]|nr:hypothetical protein [Massilia sp.]